MDKMAELAATIKKSRKSNFSPDEIEILVASVRLHYKTLYGRFAKRASNRGTRYKAWLDILRKVNMVSVEKRTLQEVKNKWKKCQYVLKERASRGLVERPELLPEEIAPGTSQPSMMMMSDSMPLQERLTKPDKQHQQSPGATGQQQQQLKSHSLSPTKLKVTRQPHHQQQQQQRLPLRVEPPTPSPVNEEMCLRWNSHHSNMQKAFPSILSKEQFVDVTLAAEGKTLKCHRLILSSCSPYFEEILGGISPSQHPVLFMKDIPFWILKSLCDFMYAGEVHICQNKLEELLQVAEALKIKGLAGKSSSSSSSESQNQNRQKPAETPTNYYHDDRRGLEIRPHFDVLQQQQQQQHHQQQQYNRVLESSGHDYESEQLLDPLDLLEPLYEEEDKKPTIINIQKPKEFRAIIQSPTQMKKVVPKKIKKRKFSDPPPRAPSPPPVFHMRKGTRSRPNVKIPKYYDTDFVQKPPPVAAPSTVTTMIELDEIKTEPIDVEENLIDYSGDEDQTAVVAPSTITTTSVTTTTVTAADHHPKFKRIKLARPIITNVTTCDDTPIIAGLEVIKIPIQNGDDTDDVIDRTDRTTSNDVEPPDIVLDQQLIDNVNNDDEDDEILTEEEMRVTSLDHLEKEAMNIANAITMESTNGGDDDDKTAEPQDGDEDPL